MKTNPVIVYAVLQHLCRYRALCRRHPNTIRSEFCKLQFSGRLIRRPLLWGYRFIIGPKPMSSRPTVHIVSPAEFDRGTAQTRGSERCAAVRRAPGLGEQSIALAGLIGGGIEADGEIRPGRTAQEFSEQSYGAHFAEVGVDEDTGEVRQRRMLGVFTAGRVLNAKTARSQAIGGMVFGVGAALHEAMALDPRFGYFVNHDLAEYHVPVHADIPAIDTVFLAEQDDKSNPLKSKGIGELGICGAAASIANAVHNACGVRVRDYPITLDKLLSKLPVRA